MKYCCCRRDSAVSLAAVAIFVMATAFIVPHVQAYGHATSGCKNFNITTDSSTSLSIDHWSTVFDTNECMRVTVHQYAGNNVWNLVCFGDFKGAGVNNLTYVPESMCDTVTVPPDSTITFKLEYTVCNDNCTFACNCQEYYEPTKPSLRDHLTYADQLCDSDNSCSAPTPAPTASLLPSWAPSGSPSLRASASPSASPSAYQVPNEILIFGTFASGAPSQEPTTTTAPTETFVCPVETVNKTEGTIYGLDIYGQEFAQTLQLNLITSAVTSSGNACVDGLICAAGVCPPFNFLFVIDISLSTTSQRGGGGDAIFPGSPVGDVNSDGKVNTILDAELDSVITAIEAIVQTPGLTNNNVDIGIVTFSTEGKYEGHWPPADPNNPDVINPAILTKLRSIQPIFYTNFDDALDKAFIYFDQYAPAVQSRTNIMYFLSDGVPNQCGDDDTYTAETFDCAQNTDNTPGASVFTSELQALAQYSVIIHSIGVGPLSEVATGSALDEIDNTEDPFTRERVTQVTTTDQLTALVLDNPVVSQILDLELRVNGNIVPGIDESDIISSPIGYAFGSYVLNGLDPTVGATNTITATVLLDVDGDGVNTLNDQLELAVSTNVVGTAP